MRGPVRPLVLVLLAACGGNAWTPQDTTAVTTIVVTERALLKFCQGDGGCNADQVQIVTTAVTCNAGSMAARHGTDILDGGGACQTTP